MFLIWLDDLLLIKYLDFMLVCYLITVNSFKCGSFEVALLFLICIEVRSLVLLIKYLHFVLFCYLIGLTELLFCTVNSLLFLIWFEVLY